MMARSIDKQIVIQDSQSQVNLDQSIYSKEHMIDDNPQKNESRSKWTQHDVVDRVEVLSNLVDWKALESIKLIQCDREWVD